MKQPTYPYEWGHPQFDTTNAVEFSQFQHRETQEPGRIFFFTSGRKNPAGESTPGA